jgi:two-component system chemotaxis response regulator CheB
MCYEAIVLGVSLGGLNAMKVMFSLLPKDFNTPIIIVQHISARSDNQWIKLIDNKNGLCVKEADEKERIENGTIYVAPPNYHLMIERSKTFSLTIDERVNFARPSIDVLFESAAEVYKDKLIGVVLTGSNNDGTNGMKRIKKLGGLTVVQDPVTAESGDMPASVIAAMRVDHVLPLDRIVWLLVRMSESRP